MAFGGIRKERIQLNNDTLWTGGPNCSKTPIDGHKHLSDICQLIQNGHYDTADALCSASFMAQPPRQAAYQPLGDLYIKMKDIDDFSYSGYARCLDLNTATATTIFRSKGTIFTWKVIASPIRQILAVQLKTDRPGKVSCHVMAGSPQPQSSVSVEGNGNELVLSGQTGPAMDVLGGLKFQARFLVQAVGGVVLHGGDHVTVDGADSVTIFIAMATSFKRYDDVTGNPVERTKQNISAASALSFETVAQEAMQHYFNIFSRVEVDLGSNDQILKPLDDRLEDFSKGIPDPALFALYFAYGRYLLISASQPESQPANLQGIWNADLHLNWDSRYTLNINTEMNYWPAETTNMPEMVQPLVSMLEELSITGSITARNMHNAGGWVCHYNTDLWRSTAPIDAPAYGMWSMGGAWLCIHLWEHYGFGLDNSYLDKVYPILEGACLF